MILSGSRYETAVAVGLVEDGEQKIWVGNRQVFDPDQDLGPNPRYLTSVGDEPMGLFAHRTLGLERQWWAVVDVNPDFSNFEDLVEDLLAVPPGTVLALPDRRRLVSS
jgi:hypothetical protein